MASILDYLQQYLAAGDPEAVGAAQTSAAMQPAVLQHLQNVLSGAQQQFRSNYDPNRSLAQNALDPQELAQAQNLAMGFTGGGLGTKPPAEPWILPAYRDPAANKIYAGTTHFGIELPEGLNTTQVDVGFVNDKGHFLNRQRAYNYADKHGLVTIPSNWRGAELMSENELQIPEQAYNYLMRQPLRGRQP